MNMTGDMNMTMNSTDMANDTITETAGGVEPVSDDGRRRLQHSLSDAASGAVDKAKDVAGKAVDKTNEVITNVNDTLQSGANRVNDFIAGAQGNMTNGTEGNMTMNSTDMANDTIATEDEPVSNM